MNTIDLRKLGCISPSAEFYLATLISKVCGVDTTKYQLSLGAKEDFGWGNDILMPYVLANLMTFSSCRVEEFISSGEWLCGVFMSGNNLSLEHRKILMSFVNTNVSRELLINGGYLSGKDTWIDAPHSLRDIFNILDDSIINKTELCVCVPKIIPIDPTQTIEDLEILSFDEIKNRIVIEWN